MRMVTKKRLMIRMERLGLRRLAPLEKMRFEIEVPVSAEFVGAQHDALILVMLVREWVEPGIKNKEEKVEKRMVLRVKDGMSVEYLGTHYIGSDNGWHLFEVTGGKEKENSE